MNHTELQSRIIRELDANQVPMLMPEIARTIGADEDATSKSLRSLRKAKRVHQVGTGSGAWRLTNGERCALAEEAKRAARIRAKKRRDDLPDPPEVPPKAPRDGLPEPAIGDLQPDQSSSEWDCTVADGFDFDEQTPAATTAMDQIAADRSPAPELATDGDTTDCSDKLTAERSGLEPAPGDTEVSAAGGGIVDFWCNECGEPAFKCACGEPEDQLDPSSPRLPITINSACVRLGHVPEPTDAELDAIEAEECLPPVPAELRDGWSTSEAKTDLAEVCRCEIYDDEPKGSEQVEDCESRRNQSTCGDCRNLEGRYFESGHQRGTCMALPRRADGLRHQRWAKQWVRNAGIGAGESCEFFVSRFGPKRIEEELDEQPYFETSQQTYICDTCKHREPYQVGWCSELKQVAKAPECALYEAVEQASIPNENPGDCRENNVERAKGPPDTEHVWGPARTKPTKGLRIEQVARELVELEARRQELLEELRGLVV